MLSSVDFQKTMTIIATMYPNSKIDLKNQLQMSLWYENLIDFEPNKLAIALKRVLATSEFAPTIATLRKAYAEVDMPVHIDAEQGWGLVEKAIRNYGYMRSDEAMNSLPAQVQRAVQYVGGFMEICQAEKVDVIRGQFNKAMQSAINSTKTEKTLGLDLNQKIRLFNIDIEQKEKLQIETKEETKMDITVREQDEKTLRSMQNVREILNKMGAKQNEK